MLDVPQLSRRELGLSVPLYIVLSTSPDIKQQAKSRRSACCGSSSAFRDVESPPNVPFSRSMLDVLDYNEREMRKIKRQREKDLHNKTQLKVAFSFPPGDPLKVG